MPIIKDDKGMEAILVEGATVVWAKSLVTPETPENGGGSRWSVKLVLDPNNPALGEIQQKAAEALNNSPANGIMPNGGRDAISQAGPQEFDGLFPGWFVINPSTYRNPQIFDEQGQAMTNPMQITQAVYTGQKVDVIVTCKYYDNKSKGIKTQLDGVRVLTSAQAQPINIGGGGFNASGAFGGGNNGGFQQQNNGGNNGGFQQQQNNGGNNGGFQPQNNGGFQQANANDYIPQ